MIFLDLDGPILDVSPRYYQLYLDLLGEKGCRLEKETYWNFKRERVPEVEIFRRSGIPEDQIEDLNVKRLKLIETQAYLALDQPWPWAFETLKSLQSIAPLVLVTQRTFKDRVLAELANLGLDTYFEKILAGRGDNSIQAKAGMITQGGFQPCATSVLVGDTEVDIRSAQALGIGSVGLLTGIRSKSKLMIHQPDVILENLAELPEYLETCIR